MTPLSDLMQQGASHAWLFMPSAILLGALHGLEPGHSKTMMAAFIVAIRGTVTQAVLLGLSATFSHTLVVWVVAFLGLRFGQQWGTETSEPYFQLGSAVLIITIALWMAARTRRDQQKEKAASHHYDHHHGHDHSHPHHHEHNHGDQIIETLGYQNSHELAHAHDIERRFSNRNVTTSQIIMFGLTGGLIPCPAAITVLLLCLQLKQFSLGVVVVLCFSIGLAVTMVASGTIAALSVKHFSKRWSGFGTLARRAPYLSCALIICVGIYTGIQGWMALSHP
jgi:ABC-type nickel/cobalt efflux system permease component RcnA